MGLVNTLINDIQESKKEKIESKNTVPEQTTPIQVSEPKLGDANIINAGTKLNVGVKYVTSESGINNNLHISSSEFDSLNKYRGTLKKTIAVLTGSAGEREDDNTQKIIYTTVGSPSIFNPYYAVNAVGIADNVPLLNTDKNGDSFSADFDGSNGKDKTTLSAKISLDNTDDCSIENLVRLSKQSNSILGQARYKYTDFMYCKELGTISNNHLITLRKFSTPVRDNIFQYTDIRDENSNMEVAGDVGRMVTWFGTESNKLEDILSYSYNASWKELEAKIQQLDSQESAPERGIVGGLVNILNPEYNKATERGIAPNALSLILGKDGSSAFLSSAPYKNNPVVLGATYDKNEIYEPKDTVRSTYKYEGKLSFTNEFTLTFNYKLRAYDNINPKSAFLDLLANILVVTYRQGVFWKGEQRLLGAPQNKAGWNKAISVMNQAGNAGMSFLTTILNGGDISDAGSLLKSTLVSITNGFFGIDMASMLKDPLGTGADIVKKMFGDGVQLDNALLGSMFNKLGRPEIYAFDSLLSNDAVGLWHVTIGNPLNPIASMGNLIITDCKITHSGPLGLDDFPTDLKVTVTLKHAMPRDSVDIQRMYTKGRHAIYSKISDSTNIQGLTNTKESGSKSNVSSQSGMTNGEPTVKDVEINATSQASNIEEIAGWFGDNSTYRINANKNTLR